MPSISAGLCTDLWKSRCCISEKTSSFDMPLIPPESLQVVHSKLLKWKHHLHTCHWILNPQNASDKVRWLTDHPDTMGGLTAHGQWIQLVVIPAECPECAPYETLGWQWCAMFWFIFHGEASLFCQSRGMFWWCWDRWSTAGFCIPFEQVQSTVYVRLITQIQF